MIQEVLEKEIEQQEEIQVPKPESKKKEKWFSWQDLLLTGVAAGLGVLLVIVMVVTGARLPSNFMVFP